MENMRKIIFDIYDNNIEEIENFPINYTFNLSYEKKLYLKKKFEEFKNAIIETSLVVPDNIFNLKLIISQFINISNTLLISLDNFKSVDAVHIFDLLLKKMCMDFINKRINKFNDFIYALYEYYIYECIKKNIPKEQIQIINIKNVYLTDIEKRISNIDLIYNNVLQKINENSITSQFNIQLLLSEYAMNSIIDNFKISENQQSSNTIENPSVIFLLIDKLSQIDYEINNDNNYENIKKIIESLKELIQPQSSENNTSNVSIRYSIPQYNNDEYQNSYFSHINIQPSNFNDIYTNFMTSGLFNSFNDSQIMDNIYILLMNIINTENTEDIENQNVPLSQELYNQKIIHSKYNKDTDETCSICLNVFDKNTDIDKLPCNHIFHTSCIKTWFAGVSKCPICRYNLITNSQN